MNDDQRDRRRKLIIFNGAGLVCVAISVLLVTTGNMGLLSWLLLGAAAVFMVVARRQMR